MREGDWSDYGQGTQRDIRGVPERGSSASACRRPWHDGARLEFVCRHYGVVVRSYGQDWVVFAGKQEGASSGTEAPCDCGAVCQYLARARHLQAIGK